MRNLVVVRAGDGSLHEAWLEGADRQWDMIVSYFGDDPNRFRRKDIPRTDAKGGKLEGIHALFSARTELLDVYDYIWLPDDDIAADCGTINRLFAIMAEYRLSLAQPSMTPESHFGHPELVRNPEFLLRYTNFVEVMMPCFESRSLARIVHLFAGLRFGWHLDEHWVRMLPEPRYGAAIIDSCAMTHTRPILTGPLYMHGSPKEEVNRIARVLGSTDRMRHMVYGGVTKEGKRVRRGPTFAWRSLKGIEATARRIEAPLKKSRRRFRTDVMKRHLKYRSDVSRIPVPTGFP